MRKPPRLAEVLEIDRVHDNFVRRRSSRRFGGKLCTPAPLREIFRWQRPSRQW